MTSQGILYFDVDHGGPVRIKLTGDIISLK
jgi:hypothetical protein